MPNTKFEKNSQEWNMFKDYYRLCEQYWQIEQGNDEYWENFVKDIEDFHKKYESISLSKRIVLALVEDLEEKSKQK